MIETQKPNLNSQLWNRFGDKASFLVLLIFVASAPMRASLSASAQDKVRPATIPVQPHFNAPVNVSNNAGETIDTQPSIAVDNDGHVHLVYTGTFLQEGAPDGVATDVFYTNNVVGDFFEPIAVTAPTGYYSHEPTLDVDSEGHAHIVFRRNDSQTFVQSDDDIYYAHNLSGSFVATRLIDGSMSGPWYGPNSPVVCVDADDNVHFAFLSDSEISYFAQVFYTNQDLTAAFAASENIYFVDSFMMALDDRAPSPRTSRRQRS